MIFELIKDENDHFGNRLFTIIDINSKEKIQIELRDDLS